MSNSNQPSSPYPSTKFEELYAVEDLSWWFKSRKKLINWLIAKVVKPKSGIYLEIGCGTGYMLSAVKQKFPSLEVIGAEYHITGVSYAAKRNQGIRILHLDATKLDQQSAYDYIAAYDVIEHIQKDAEAITNLFRALRAGGYLIVTVPQHEWLWSNVDVLSCHQRRYQRTGLEKLLRSNGFKMLYVNSFMSLVLPLMLISRSLKRSKGSNTNELRPAEPISILLNGLCWLEFQLIRLGISLPLGGSLAVIAQKPLEEL